MNELKANTISIGILGIILLGLLISLNFLISRFQLFGALSYILISVLIYLLILLTLPRQLIINRNKGGVPDIDQFFYYINEHTSNQHRKYFYDFNKVLEFKDGELTSRPNVSQSDRDSLQKYILIASLFSPLIGRIILGFSNASISDLGFADFVLYPFYIALLFVNVIVFIIMRAEAKNSPHFFVKFTKSENSLRITIKVIPFTLVRNTKKKLFVMDLPLESIEDIALSSVYKQGMKNSDSKFTRLMLKSSKFMVKYPDSLNLDHKSTSVTIVKIPEFKHTRSIENAKKSSVFLACKDIELLKQFRSNIISWARN